MTHLRYYMYLLFEALQHAHAKGVMHRGIKPDNVLVDLVTKKLIVIDFGRYVL